MVPPLGNISNRKFLTAKLLFARAHFAPTGGNVLPAGAVLPLTRALFDFLDGDIRRRYGVPALRNLV
ncbi:MAG: hypothetical protein K2P26_03280, partial [Oscillospiraceae bacterium]|nr:hypothetical protein [Oscillospiraceae bacterium]